MAAKTLVHFSRECSTIRKIMVGPTLEAWAWACACAWRCMACIGGAVFWRDSVPAMHGEAVFWRGNVPGVHAILLLGVTQWVKLGSHSRLGLRATVAPCEPHIRYYRGFSLLPMARCACRHRDRRCSCQ